MILGLYVHDGRQAKRKQGPTNMLGEVGKASRFMVG